MAKQPERRSCTTGAGILLLLSPSICNKCSPACMKTQQQLQRSGAATHKTPVCITSIAASLSTQTQTLRGQETHSENPHCTVKISCMQQSTTNPPALLSPTIRLLPGRAVQLIGNPGGAHCATCSCRAQTPSPSSLEPVVSCMPEIAAGAACAWAAAWLLLLRCCELLC
jgi:hypothetical protein